VFSIIEHLLDGPVSTMAGYVAYFKHYVYSLSHTIIFHIQSLPSDVTQEFAEFEARVEYIQVKECICS
jgi:hypothetical protein